LLELREASALLQVVLGLFNDYFMSFNAVVDGLFVGYRLLLSVDQPIQLIAG